MAPRWRRPLRARVSAWTSALWTIRGLILAVWVEEHRRRDLHGILAINSAATEAERGEIGVIGRRTKIGMGLPVKAVVRVLYRTRQ